MKVDIQKKPKFDFESKKIQTPENIWELEEVQEIKDAMQEYVLMIGMDSANNLKNITMVGIGTSNEATINLQNIMRTALINGYSKFVLVHNHPSNSLISSMNDKIFSNICSKVAQIFNIELLDHIIVTEDNFVSMKRKGELVSDVEEVRVKFLEDYLKYDDSFRMKKEIRQLKEKLTNYERQNNEIKNDEMECEM